MVDKQTGGICNSCEYFRANVSPIQDKPHYCDFQKAALSKFESQQHCDECIPKSKGCSH